MKNSCRSIGFIFREFNPFALSLTVFWGEMHLFFYLLPLSLSVTVLGWVAIGLFLLEINTDRPSQTTQFGDNLADKVCPFIFQTFSAAIAF